MKIHQVIVTEEVQHSVDPRRGVIARREQVLQQGSTREIKDPEHGKFDIGSDGAFDVPDELGLFFLKQPGWFEGANPYAEVKTTKRGAKAAA